MTTRIKNFLCPHLEAKGWHMFVGYHTPNGDVVLACHGCGEYDE